jgi:hypothetical protein
MGKAWQLTLIPAASLVPASSPSSYLPSSTYLYASSCSQITHVHSIPSSHSYYITTSSPCSSKYSPSIPHSRLPSTTLVLSSSYLSNSPPNLRLRLSSSPQHYTLPFTSTWAKQNLLLAVQALALMTLQHRRISSSCWQSCVCPRWLSCSNNLKKRMRFS